MADNGAAAAMPAAIVDPVEAAIANPPALTEAETTLGSGVNLPIVKELNRYMNIYDPPKDLKEHKGKVAANMTGNNLGGPQKTLLTSILQQVFFPRDTEPQPDAGFTPVGDEKEKVVTKVQERLTGGGDLAEKLNNIEILRGRSSTGHDPKPDGLYVSQDAGPKDVVSNPTFIITPGVILDSASKTKEDDPHSTVINVATKATNDSVRSLETRYIEQLNLNSVIIPPITMTVGGGVTDKYTVTVPTNISTSAQTNIPLVGTFTSGFKANDLYFKGNVEKNTAIKKIIQKPAPTAEEQKEVKFSVLGKELGDTLQVAWLKKLIESVAVELTEGDPIDFTSGNSVVTTNDTIVWLRCIVNNVPVILTVNGKTRYYRSLQLDAAQKLATVLAFINTIRKEVSTHNLAVIETIKAVAASPYPNGGTTGGGKLWINGATWDIANHTNAVAYLNNLAARLENVNKDLDFILSKQTEIEDAQRIAAAPYAHFHNPFTWCKGESYYKTNNKVTKLCVNVNFIAKQFMNSNFGAAVAATTSFFQYGGAMKKQRGGRRTEKEKLGEIMRITTDAVLSEAQKTKKLLDLASQEFNQPVEGNPYVIQEFESITKKVNVEIAKEPVGLIAGLTTRRGRVAGAEKDQVGTAIATRDTDAGKLEDLIATTYDYLDTLEIPVGAPSEAIEALKQTVKTAASAATVGEEAADVAVTMYDAEGTEATKTVAIDAIVAAKKLRATAREEAATGAEAAATETERIGQGTEAARKAKAIATAARTEATSARAAAGDVGDDLISKWKSRNELLNPDSVKTNVGNFAKQKINFTEFDDLWELWSNNTDLTEYKLAKFKKHPYFVYFFVRDYFPEIFTYAYIVKKVMIDIRDNIGATAGQSVWADFQATAQEHFPPGAERNFFNTKTGIKKDIQKFNGVTNKLKVKYDSIPYDYVDNSYFLIDSEKYPADMKEPLKVNEALNNTLKSIQLAIFFTDAFPHLSSMYSRAFLDYFKTQFTELLEEKYEIPFWAKIPAFTEREDRNLVGGGKDTQSLSIVQSLAMDYYELYYSLAIRAAYAGTDVTEEEFDAALIQADKELEKSTSFVEEKRINQVLFKKSRKNNKRGTNYSNPSTPTFDYNSNTETIVSNASSVSLDNNWRAQGGKSRYRKTQKKKRNQRRKTRRHKK